MEQCKILPLKNMIDCEVTIPGSKSYTNRALIMGALANGKTTLTGISESDDSVAMIKALQQLGVEIKQTGETIEIIGTGGQFRPFSGTINVGAAGTTMRFLASVAALVPGEIILDGSERMRERPINELVDALRDLGVRIEYMMKEGCPPLKIHGGSIKGGTVEMDGSFSSQYFTSLMLIAPVLEKGIKIIVKGEQVSKSYIDMTVDGLESFGVKVTNNNYEEYVIAPGSHYKPTNYHIEGDCSGAAYFWSIAALNGGHIRVHNINPTSAQGDVHFPDLLEKMGCKVVKNQVRKWIEVTGVTELNGLAEVVDMESMPDTAQPLAVVASFANGITHLGGLSTLRIKETDRIAAMNIELAKCGVETEIGSDWIKIIPGKPIGTVIDTYKDHRMAMSFALLGTKVNGVIVNEPNVVSKSFPEFWDLLDQIGVEIEKLQIH